MAGADIDAVDNDAECNDADERLEKRRWSEGFFILRNFKDDADGGPCNGGLSPTSERKGRDGRRVTEVVGNCTSPVGAVRRGDEGKERQVGSTITGECEGFEPLSFEY